MIGWQNSPEHNATMTNPQYTEVGIGRAYNEASHYGWYWTATYGAGEGPQTVPEPLPAPVAVTDPALVTETTVDEAPTSSPTTVAWSSQQPRSTPTATVRLHRSNPVADGTATRHRGDINTGGVRARRSSMSRLPSACRVIRPSRACSGDHDHDDHSHHRQQRQSRSHGSDVHRDDDHEHRDERGQRASPRVVFARTSTSSAGSGHAHGRSRFVAGKPPARRDLP